MWQTTKQAKIKLIFSFGVIAGLIYFSGNLGAGEFLSNHIAFGYGGGGGGGSNGVGGGIISGVSPAIIGAIGTEGTVAGVEYYEEGVQPLSAGFFSGDLVKLACDADTETNDPCRAVYYLGRNSKRYVFPNEKIYKTWYSGYSTVKIIPAEDLAQYSIGGNATYRPGTKLVKIQTDPRVYAIGRNGALHWLETEAVAEKFYGDNWNTIIHDIQASFFANYAVGVAIDLNSNYNRIFIQAASPNINTDKGL